jgi:predicted RNA-binding protein YlxR (DUF448 family)
LTEPTETTPEAGPDDAPETARRTGPQTHAQAHRQRRCIMGAEVMDEDRLIRFVTGPDGVVVPDLARKLPGRGLWVEAQRGQVELAVRKNVFARAAKAPVKPPADLADQVERLLKKRVLDGLGLAKRAGDLISGFDRVSEAIGKGKVAWLIEAADGSADGRHKLTSKAFHAPRPPRLIGLFSSDELGLALGLDNVIHLAFLAGRGADRWTRDVERLSGFRPLLPESWREEP